MWFLFPAAEVMSVPDSPAVLAGQESSGQDSLKMQARHYKTLSNMYNKPNAKPKQSNVAQLLDLEFEARRAFIDSDSIREEDRATQIFEAYPCFKDTRNVSVFPFSLELICACFCARCVIHYQACNVVKELKVQFCPRQWMSCVASWVAPTPNT